MIQVKQLLATIHKNKRLCLIGIVLYCTVLIFVILHTAMAFDPLYQSSSITTLPLSGEWSVTEDGVSTGQHRLPYTVQNKKCRTVELSLPLPETPFNPAVLVTLTYQTKLEVLLDGSSIYKGVFEKQGRERFTPGSSRTLFPLPTDFAGKTLTLRYTRYVFSDTSAIGMVSLDKLDTGGLQLSGRGLLFFIMTGIASVGVLMLAISLFASGRGLLSAPLFYLSLFAVIAPIWVLCNSKLAQVFTSNLILIHNVEYICFYLFPLPMLAFLLVNWPLRSRASTCLLHLLSGFFVLTLTLKAVGLCDFFALIHLYHLLLLCSVLCTLLGAWRLRNTQSPSLRLFLGGVLLLTVFGGVDIVRFYLIPDFDAIFFIVGMVCMGVCVIASYLLSARNQVKEQIASEMYKTLAYTDKLTGIRNRLSFEEDLELLGKSVTKHTSIIFVNVDVNDFKAINDNYGHMIGDHVLQAVARELSQRFRGVATCYRMGGDEFCLVALNQRLEQIETTMTVLNNQLAHGLYSPSLSVAYGLAEYNPFLHQTLIDVFRAADNHMYEFKRRYKGH
ncbi:MAG: GGDEF domain-containing protein [Angelakisella sp.]